MKTDLELQLALAKMLPEKIKMSAVTPGFYWKENALYRGRVSNNLIAILDTEWLHVCWLIEQGMPYDNSIKGRVAYDNKLMTICGSHQACVSASWQQRASALIAVKGEK